MATGWHLGAIIKSALSCFIEVAFYWQLVCFLSSYSSLLVVFDCEHC
jgi:hypothetical protein